MHPPSNSSEQAASPATKALERLLEQMNPTIARSFNEEQREALQVAMATTLWQKHPVDIRLSIPLLLQRYYVVVVAGPEKRSRERRQQDKSCQSVSIPGQMAMMIALTALGIGALTVLMRLTQTPTQVSQPRPISPAAIPFLSDRRACEQSNRTWENGECLDFKHDPTF
ncbi:hypothetical protein [Leptolyngbya sp. KIOST-1]|uniref:hypothetical protein n=1 Tax=Leptolyngbya sp. KIOST-1 TaxID=1229172 RepID=UPI00055CEF56|nr:hypothetical protein [Leptolyngbya sp. KIOST-1]